MDSGEIFEVHFELPAKLQGRIGQFDNIQIKFEKRSSNSNQGVWYVVQPDGTIHTRDISYNHHSGEINAKDPLVSIHVVIFNYDEDIGILYINNNTCCLNKQEAPGLFGNNINCENDIDWINRPLAKILKHESLDKRRLQSCNIKWSNSQMFNPSKENGCIRFTAASEGPIYFSASAVPARRESWYNVRISTMNVTVWKGTKRLKQMTNDLSAVGLGSINIYQTYFVCLQYSDGLSHVSGRKKRFAHRKNTKIMYGKLVGDEAIGDDIYSHGYLTIIDDDEPLIPYFYAFGSGEDLVKIVDVQVTLRLSNE